MSDLFDFPENSESIVLPERLQRTTAVYAKDDGSLVIVQQESQFCSEAFVEINAENLQKFLTAIKDMAERGEIG